MQKIVVLLLLMGITTPALYAQQKSIRHMALTIYQDFGLGGHQDLIETHDDGTQNVRRIKWPLVKSEKTRISREDSVMVALKPYFDAGWEISAATETDQSNSGEFIIRIFLWKEE